MSSITKNAENSLLILSIFFSALILLTDKGFSIALNIVTTFLTFIGVN